MLLIKSNLHSSQCLKRGKYLLFPEIIIHRFHLYICIYFLKYKLKYNFWEEVVIAGLNIVLHCDISSKTWSFILG